MVYDLSDVLLDLVCHYFIKDFCIDIYLGNSPVVLLFEGIFVWFWDESNIGLKNELCSVPSLSILWNSLRRVGISSSLNI
jgi:hypothetical protein